MTRLFLLAPLLLSACVEGMTADPAAPRMSQAGTCFAFVTAQADGTYTLTTGIGDGTKTPVGQQKTGLSAAAVDAAFAQENKIMQINPECLAIYAKDRSQAAPAAPTA
ncbi:MAG: hypothetical protein PHX82_04850 [Paracoccaceae bacterium]|jgi:hypothetical protein|nr:hypothetical protein [Paracoccaceae bacterium]